MRTYTVRLDDPAATDPALSGGKGAALAALTIAGFPVPAGFVVTTTAYRDGAPPAAADPDGPAAVPEGPAAVPDGPAAGPTMPGALAAQILAAYAELGSPPVAVRSSGTAEDLADASFAGQHDSFLDVAGADAVVAAVRACWASLWTPRAVAYRERSGYDECRLALAVVVQTMVAAQWAGVLFTADPLSGRRDRLVLEAVPGLADALAAGEQTGRRVVWDKTAGVTVQDDARLPAEALAELADLAGRVEEHFDAPQDIEWAYADGRCWLVQARPLTALPEDPGAESPPPSSPRRRGVGNVAMLAEHVPAPPFPMDVSMLLRPGLQAVRAAARRAGLAAPPVEDVVVEIGDGVVQVVPPSVRLTPRAVAGLAAAAPKIVGLLRTKPAEWRAEFDATAAPLARRLDTEDLTGLSEREIIARVLQLRAAVGRLVASRFGAVPGGVLAGLLARRLLRLVVGDEATRLHEDLISAAPSVTTAANAAMDRIAARVRSTPQLRVAYLAEDSGSVAERLRTSPEGRALLDDIDDYLRRYGFRETTMMSIGAPPLRERPDTVHGLIEGLARHEPSAHRDPDERLGRARRELADRRGVRARVFRPTIVRLLKAARASAGFREDSHYQFMMALAVTRRLLLEIGRRMAERGIVSDPADVVYLELNEIEELSSVQARATIERRKSARAAVLDHYTIVPAELLSTEDGDGVHGTPSSRGTAVGRVRLVRGESEFAELLAGEVLVCPYTNPTWTPLFSLACAVVADTGGPGSHAAIVAREYGIPAVMGTGNGTRLLATGDRVLVDADRGTVTRL